MPAEEIKPHIPVLLEIEFEVGLYRRDYDDGSVTISHDRNAARIVCGMSEAECCSQKLHGHDEHAVR